MSTVYTKKMVCVQGDVYSQLLKVIHVLEKKENRKISFSEAIKHLIKHQQTEG